MHVEALWRYPVKSLGGERLDTALVSEDGIHGDRIALVASTQRRLITSRTHPRLLLLGARLGADGEPEVGGRAWSDPAVAAAIEDAAGAGSRIFRYEEPDRFDVMPLLVATDGAIAAFGRDVRRLRPNIVIGGVEGLAERDWPGRELRIGECVIAVRSLRTRCVMTTWDPDTAEQDPGVLKDIVRRFGGQLALNCEVLRGGVIAVGDGVAISDPDAGP
jgi:uncharacterized protein YcbX